MNIEDLKKYKYISFDIFDTLIFRNVSKPIDIFKLVEIEYNKMHEHKLDNFKQDRIEAELKARRKSKSEEITLDEIYDNLKCEYKDDIKKLELEIEKSFIVKNPEMFEIYSKCLESGCKIIITSDMYLNIEFIKDILKENGYEGYEKIYLSSELKKTKSKGSIFKYILKDLSISKEEIIHIGDNKKSDYLVPTSLGINAICYERKKYNIHICEDIKEKDLFYYNSLNAFINNTIDIDKNYFWKLGYETFGPLLYSYSKWLKENFINEKYDKVFFLARDGYIMQKVFNIINKEDIPNEYMYASRRALIVPTIWMYENLEEILNNMFLGTKISINSLIKRLGLNPEEKKELLKKYNFELETKINSNEILNNKDFLGFYEEVKEEIIQNSKEEFNNLLNYYNNIKFNGKVAIVDIGWFGNMQNALNKLVSKANINAEISGYYVGVIPDSKNQNTNIMKGFLFEKNKNEEFALKKKFFNSIFEMVFLSTHGSVKRYNGKENIVDMYEFEYENTDTEKSIRDFQAGAISFVEKFIESKSNEFIEINERVAFYNMIGLGNYPNLEDAEMLGDMIFYDDDIFYLAKPKDLSYYITKPKEFYEDFMDSAWMPGFLKRIFKVNLPYFKFILLLRKIKNNKKEDNICLI